MGLLACCWQSHACFLTITCEVPKCLVYYRVLGITTETYMPFETMDTEQVARYLHLDERDVRKLALRDKMPCRKRQGEFIFSKIQVDHWVERQLHQLPDRRLTEIEAGVRRYHGLQEHERDFLVCDMIPRGGVAVPLTARTTHGVLRDLVNMGDTQGLIYGRDELLDAITQRERICSTAIWPHVALPHPLHPLPYDVAEPFIIVGRCDSGIPFAAADGSLTRLFILVCGKDDGTHLHVLARLARILCRDEVVNALLGAKDRDELLRLLRQAEREAISTQAAQ